MMLKSLSEPSLKSSRESKSPGIGSLEGLRGFAMSSVWGGFYACFLFFGGDGSGVEEEDGGNFVEVILTARPG